MLAEGGIGIRADMEDDLLNEEVTYEAKEAIDFLNSREKFWDQLELGSQNNRAGKEKQAKTMGSLRWLMWNIIIDGPLRKTTILRKTDVIIYISNILVGTGNLYCELYSFKRFKQFWNFRDALSCCGQMEPDFLFKSILARCEHKSKKGWTYNAPKSWVFEARAYTGMKWLVDLLNCSKL